MDKKVVNKKTGIIIGVAVILLVVLGVGGFLLSRGSADQEENMLQLGQRYLDELNYEQAMACFEAYLEIDPKSVEAYLGLAVAYEGLQAYEKALEVLEKGYAVTKDDRLMEMIEHLREEYEEILPPEDSSEPNQAEGYLQEILVFDGTYESYGYAYGGSIPVKKDGMWGAINYDNEVIVPFEYEGYVSPDNLGNFVLYDSDRGYFLFDNQGNVLYRGEDSVRASGGMYITEHFDVESWSSLITYRSLDGKELVSWECGGDVWINGFYDGISNLYDSLHAYVVRDESKGMGPHEEDVPPRIGTVDLQGNLTWRVDPSYYIWWDERNEEIEHITNSKGHFYGDGASYSAIMWNSVLSTVNHGYYITGSTAYGMSPETFVVYDKDDNKVATICLRWMSIDDDGTVSIDDSIYDESNNRYRGFWSDGFTLWNYGSKMVFLVNDKNILVDFAQNSAGGESVSTDVVTAVYDYISMADENYWLVQSGDQWGYIDHDGNEMALFQDAGNFVNGYALVKEDGEAWLIDEEFHKLESLGQAYSVWVNGELYGVTVGGQQHLYQLR